LTKKTFIKVRRGILDPKHRRKMGEAVWLYLFILDRADWEEGAVIEYKDLDAAESLGLPLSTLRVQRRKLEDACYIRTIQHQHFLEITISKWENPKEKNINKPVEGYNEGDNEGDSKLTPSNNEGDNQGDIQGYNEGASELTPLHRIKKLRISDSQINSTLSSSDHDFVADFLKTSGISSLSKSEQGYEITDLRDKYGAEKVLFAAAWVRDKKITKIEKAISSLRTALPAWTMPTKKQSTLDLSLEAIKQFDEEEQNAIIQ